MKMIFFTRPVIKILAVVGVLLGFVLVVYLMSGLPAPREENRVGPASGAFSIIHPPDWETQLIYAPANKQYTTELTIRPIKSVGREQRIFVGRLREPPDLQKLASAGFANVLFQGQPALIKAGQQKHEYVWHAVFERAGSWYDLMLVLVREEDIPHSDWWPYLNSFRAREVAATTAPASMPAMIPTTIPETHPAQK